jgi:hypothetical protein
MALKAVQGAERREKGVLYGVGAVLLRSEEPAGDAEHAPGVLTDKCLAGTFISVPDASEQPGIV